MLPERDTWRTCVQKIISSRMEWRRVVKVNEVKIPVCFASLLEPAGNRIEIMGSLGLPVAVDLTEPEIFVNL